MVHKSSQHFGYFFFVLYPTHNQLYICYMIHLSTVLRLASQRNQKFSIKFVAAGDKRTNRKGGYIVEMRNCILMSSSAKYRRLNIKQLDSGQIREAKYILIIEFNGKEVFI